MPEPSATAGRVLLITNNLPPVRGGSGIVYDALAKEAEGRIIVMAPRISYVDGLPLIGWREHDRRASYTVIRRRLLRTVMRGAASSPLRRLRFLLQDASIRLGLLTTLARCLLRQRVGVVCIGELVASAWIFNFLRLFPSVIRVAYVHGEEITTRTDYDTSRKRRRRALLAAHYVVTVSRFTAATVAELLGEQAHGRIRLIENGVDASRFRPVPRRPALVARYGLQDGFVFMSVCRLLEKKGIDHTIRAFVGVAAKYPECRLLVVGDGPYRAELEALAARCRLADRITFTGVVEDSELVDHYALGDVFVMPNRRLADGDTEGFGLVFLEANACGLPVIAGQDGGSRDAVSHGVNGLLVDGHDVDAIGSAMLEMRRDTALRAQLRAGGFEAAAAADWRHKTKTFLGMFDVIK